MRISAIILIALCAAPVSAQTELTLKIGQEFDSNPIRLSGAGSDPAAAARIVTAVEHDSQVAAGGLSFDAQALGRLYYVAATEDSLSLSLSSELAGPLSERSSLGVHFGARNRIERARDCAIDSETPCAVNQDYGTLSAGARHILRLDDVSWSLGIGPRAFSYKPSSDFSWYGPGVMTGLDWRVHANFTVGGFYDLMERFYHSDRQRITIANGLVTIDGERRVDRGQTVGVSARWRRRSWSLSGEYVYQWNVSNSATKAYMRHLLEPAVTGIPFGDVLVRISGRITRSSFDPRRAQDETTNIDEESRNRVSIVVEQPLYSDVLFVEAGWTLYAQALHGVESDDDESFRRTLAHIALTVRGRGSAD
jgi:hypothetical protein